MEKTIIDKNNLKLFLNTIESGAGFSNSLSNAIDQINDTSNEQQYNWHVEYDEASKKIKFKGILYLLFSTVQSYKSCIS